MRRLFPIALGLLALFLPGGTHAQQTGQSIELGVDRDFGFQAGGRIQGTFTLRVEGRDDLIQATFLLDGDPFAVVTETPFHCVIRTGDFPLGRHDLSAVAVMSDGEELSTPEREYEFVSADEGWKTALTIVGPLFGLILVFTLVGVLGPLLLGRRAGVFRLGEYGMAGGAVCPRCGLPFPRHFLSPNLLVGKLDRCPHCGRWSIAPQASAEALEAAEARFTEDSGRGVLRDEGEEDIRKRRIEDSRYES